MYMMQDANKFSFQLPGIMSLLSILQVGFGAEKSTVFLVCVLRQLIKRQGKESKVKRYLWWSINL